MKHLLSEDDASTPLAHQHLLRINTSCASTPLAHEELEQIRLVHIQTREQLNAAEQANIRAGLAHSILHITITRGI